MWHVEKKHAHVDHDRYPTVLSARRSVVYTKRVHTTRITASRNCCSQACLKSHRCHQVITNPHAPVAFRQLHCLIASKQAQFLDIHC